VERDTAAPAFEFNWGALPDVHLHIIAPLAGIQPSNNPALSPSGQGPRAFGPGDIELGIKYRFVQEMKHRPMIGTFVMFEIPTGSAARGLGVGKTWYKVPLWAQKTWGPWTTYGGGGVTLVNFISIPGLEEQAAIAAFLDERTSQIDLLIEKKRCLAALLDEQRQALISRAVTRGLDPTVAMKESGVDWLGPVPAHWNVAPLKYLAEVQSGITVGKKYDPDQTLVERPYLRVANVQDGYLDLENIASIEIPLRNVAQYELQPGDVVVTEGGDFDKLARGYVWDGQIAGCMHQNHIFAVRPKQERLRSPFLSALMTSLYGRNYFTATSVQSTNLACTNRAKLGGFPIPLPSPKEQDSICHALELADIRFQKATQQLRSTIDRLREYRSALITAAVTGQLDLREHERKLEALA
jgi:type I restriction enzyme S subunit